MGRVKRLSMFQALMSYLGSKRRLVGVVGRELDRILPREKWSELVFYDAFLGGGSVSLWAKAMGFSVVSTDIAERSLITGRALLENNRVRLTQEDVLRIAAPSDEPPGRIERDYSPQVFTQTQARLLDRAFAVAETTPDPAKGALLRLLALRVALLIHPMSQVRPGTIGRITTGDFENVTESCLPRYITGLRITRPEPLWELARQINGGVFEGRAKVHKADMLEKLSEIDAHIVYCDPPYGGGVMGYEKEYRVIDEILEGQAKPLSPFTGTNGAAQLDPMFERAQHIPIWILSYGNVGITSHDLAATMQRFGRETRALEIEHQHLPAVATAQKKQENRELLVVGWDPEAPLLRGRRPAMEGAAR